jgi:integrase
MSRSPYGTVRRLPSGHYQARLRVGGPQISLGTFPTRRQAGQAVARATTSRQVGKDETAASPVALAEFTETWWTTRSGHRLSTQKRDRGILDVDVLPFFGHQMLGDITPSSIQAWVSEVSGRLAPASVRRSYTVLAQVLEAAVEMGLLAASPAARARLPRVTRSEMRFLNPVELEALAGVIDRPWRVMVLAMAWATLRISEAAGLRRVDIDVVSGTLRVANSIVEVDGHLIEGPPKTAAGRRTMTMPTSVMAELADHLDRFAGDSYVFVGSNDGPLRPSWWRSATWRPAVIRAGLLPLRPHDLKHTGVAFLAAAGVDPSEIARRAGHASVAFTYDHYGHLLPEVDKQAAAKLEQLREQSKT